MDPTRERVQSAPSAYLGLEAHGCERHGPSGLRLDQPICVRALHSRNPALGIRHSSRFPDRSADLGPLVRYDYLLA